MTFEDNEYHKRLDNVLKFMNKKDIDVFVVSGLENIYYLTNIQSLDDSLQILVIHKDREICNYFFTRKVEEKNAIIGSNIKNIITYSDSEDPEQIFIDKMNKNSFSKIGLELKSSRFPTNLYKKIIYQFDVEIVDVSNIINELRMIKSDNELFLMKKSADLTVQGIKAGVASLDVGVNEDYIAANIHFAMYSQGTEYAAYPPFIASGLKISCAHSTNQHKNIQDDELVQIGTAGCFKRYCTPLTRTCYVGKEIPNIVVETEQVVLEALSRAMEMMKPGVKFGDVDELIKEIIGYEFKSCYSVGINFCIGYENYIPLDKQLEKNMTIHLKPCVYIQDLGGICISDTIYITENGAKSLFNVPKNIIHIKPKERIAKFVDENFGTCSKEIITSIATSYNSISEHDNYTLKIAKYVLSKLFGNTKHIEFVMNGTNANVLSLTPLVKVNEKFLCTSMSHIYRKEKKVLEKLMGCEIIGVQTKGKITVDHIKEYLGEIRLVSIEQPTEYGELYSLEELDELYNFTKENGLYFHIDGDRLCNAVSALDKNTFEEYGDICDVLSLGAKGLVFGNIVAINEEHKQKTHYYSDHIFDFSNNRFMACQLLEMFSGDLWFRNAKRGNLMAKYLEKRLSSFKDYIEITRPVLTNAVFVKMSEDLENGMSKKYDFEKYDNEIRLMCSFNTTEKDVEELIGYLLYVVQDKYGIQLDTDLNWHRHNKLVDESVEEPQDDNRLSSKHEWKKIFENMLKSVKKNIDPIKILDFYIRIKTFHPKPKYKYAITFLSYIANTCNLDYWTVPLCSNSKALMISKGYDNKKETVLFTCHMDTADVKCESTWKTNPFDLITLNGRLFGRGTQKMKAIGIMYLVALIKLAKNHHCFEKNIVLCYVPDGEKFGFMGMCLLSEKLKNVCLAIGGCKANKDSCLTLFNRERKMWWMRLTATGKDSISKIMKITNTMTYFTNEEKKKLLFCDDLGDIFSIRMSYCDFGDCQMYNEIPEKAVAGYDIRIPAEYNLNKFESKIKRWTKGVKCELIKGTHMDYLENPSSNKNKKIEKILENWKIPYQYKTSSIPTDLRFLRSKGIESIGFSPFFKTPDLTGNHNEHIRVKDFFSGIDLYYDLMLQLGLNK